MESRLAELERLVKQLQDQTTSLLSILATIHILIIKLCNHDPYKP